MKGLIYFTISGQTKTKNKSAERWSPKCFEDLRDLPCIIIVSGRERPGDTFPRWKDIKYLGNAAAVPKIRHLFTVISRAANVVTVGHQIMAEQNVPVFNVIPSVTDAISGKLLRLLKF